MNTLETKTLTGANGMAVSECGRYRYLLWRIWDAAAPPLGWIMLNPSTANHLEDDATIRRCVKRAEAGGYGGILVANLFAFRATKPRDMMLAADPVGPENNLAIAHAAEQCRTVIAAWGAIGAHRGRGAAVARAISRKHPGRLHYLRLGRNGEPAHPLYLPADLAPLPWDVPPGVTSADPSCRDCYGFGSFTDGQPCACATFDPFRAEPVTDGYREAVVAFERDILAGAGVPVRIAEGGKKTS